MTFGALFRTDRNQGIPSLFRGRKISYSFNTRVAIRKACDLLGLKPGDEVLAPAYNCGSELDPLRHAGLAITLYPVHKDTRIDLAGIEALVSARTRAVYLTHYFGFLQPETQALRALCDRHGLVLIEDCALSLLSGQTPAEGFAGDISVFCFYKFFPVLGGGAMVINNKDINGEVEFTARVPRSKVNRKRIRHGLEMLLGPRGLSALKSLLRRPKSSQVTPSDNAVLEMPPHYYFDPDIKDARIDIFASRPIRSFDPNNAIRKRRENYLTYLRQLSGINGVEPLFPNLPDNVCPLSMPVLLKCRDSIADALIEKNIAATPWWSGYNRHLTWGPDCADARYLKDHVLSLPVNQHLGDVEIAYIISQLKNSLKLHE